MHLCRNCKIEIPPTDKQRKGHGYICSLCLREQRQAHSQRRTAAGNPIIHQQMSAKWTRAYEERRREVPGVREAKAERARRYAQDPAQRHKHIARWAAHHAVASGKLVRVPCKCGEPKSEAHHPDYSKPLEVLWLCRPCHNEEHKAIKAQVRSPEVTG